MVYNSAKLTSEIKEYALKVGADLVGVVSSKVMDAFPKIWVGWTIQEYTKKTTEIMSDAKSVVVLGYHVWDDILEVAVRKSDKWIYLGYLPLRIAQMKVIQFLRNKGFKAVSVDSLSLKRLAQLAGFGNFGKSSLIINPIYGPWIRFAVILTNAELIPDKPFEEDLCEDCEECVKACPVGALTPYRVDDTKCLVGIHLTEIQSTNYMELIRRYEPSLTENSHLMCTECQKACKYGRIRR